MASSGAGRRALAVLADHVGTDFQKRLARVDSRAALRLLAEGAGPEVLTPRALAERLAQDLAGDPDRRAGEFLQLAELSPRNRALDLMTALVEKACEPRPEQDARGDREGRVLGALAVASALGEGATPDAIQLAAARLRRLDQVDGPGYNAQRSGRRCLEELARTGGNATQRALLGSRLYTNQVLDYLAENQGPPAIGMLPGKLRNGLNEALQGKDPDAVWAGLVATAREVEGFAAASPDGQQLSTWLQRALNEDDGLDTSDYRGRAGRLLGALAVLTNVAGGVTPEGIRAAAAELAAVDDTKVSGYELRKSGRAFLARAVEAGGTDFQKDLVSDWIGNSSSGGPDLDLVASYGSVEDVPASHLADLARKALSEFREQPGYGRGVTRLSRTVGRLARLAGAADCAGGDPIHRAVGAWGSSSSKSALEGTLRSTGGSVTGALTVIAASDQPDPVAAGIAALKNALTDTDIVAQVSRSEVVRGGLVVLGLLARPEQLDARLAGAGLPDSATWIRQAVADELKDLQGATAGSVAENVTRMSERALRQAWEMLNSDSLSANGLRSLKELTYSVQETAIDGARLQRELGRDASHLEAVTTGLEALDDGRLKSPPEDRAWTWCASGWATRARTSALAALLAAHTVLAKTGPTVDPSTLGRAREELEKATGDPRVQPHATRMIAVATALIDA
ncbi:MAG: hypothetical protein AB1758_33190, partial [Candidatus Eremiobacterota bacterium]